MGRIRCRRFRTSRAAEWTDRNYHTPVGTYGHTILRGSQGRYLLFKHDTYGGEHDHYDRLGISYMAFGKPVSADLGTTGYGAALHYDYYKNTGTHNTVVIGEENQAPAACRLLQYEEDGETVYVTAECDWTAPYEMPDSFTIVQWKKENYETVKMTRKDRLDGFLFRRGLLRGPGRMRRSRWTGSCT